jgi:hypothetical protein
MNYYFVGLLVICAIYALAAGGSPERIGAAAYALSVAATYLVLWSESSEWRTVEFGVLIIDALVFAAFTFLALRADRFWPIWVSGLLGLGLLGHVARLAGPEIIPWAYAVVLTIWSYPILALMALGTFNHQRRLKRFGSDPSWSSSSGRSAPPTAPTR